MKRCSSILLAASSLLWLLTASADVRPHYGGTLHIAVHEPCPTLDAPTSRSCGNVSNLVFEGLVGLDRRGRPQPLLATSWQAEPGSQRWRFQLRRGVSFHDGAALEGPVVAASLRNANPDWKVFAVGQTIVIETTTPDPNLPAELALARNLIVRHAGDQWLGTGPFAVQSWDPGKHLSLAANDQYWGGRPFLDAVEVDFGAHVRDELLALDIGKADVINLTAENIRRARAEGHVVLASEPAQLLALVFAADPRSEEEIHLRNALALSLDTAAMNNVVLQGGGEVSGSLLPNWLSGYAFGFPSGANLAQARQERALASHVLPMTLGYDASDPIARVIADRVLLNSRDVGIALELTSSPKADVRLVRLPLDSLDPQVALEDMAKALHLPFTSFNGNSAAELFSAEKNLLQAHRVIPLLHLRSALASRSNIHGIEVLSDGTWKLDSVWLSTGRP